MNTAIFLMIVIYSHPAVVTVQVPYEECEKMKQEFLNAKHIGTREAQCFYINEGKK